MNLQPLLDSLAVLLDQRNGASHAILVSPLPPEAEREALSDFRRRLPRELPHAVVTMEEITIFRKRTAEYGQFLKTTVSVVQRDPLNRDQ